VLPELEEESKDHPLQKSRLVMFSLPSSSSALFLSSFAEAHAFSDLRSERRICNITRRRRRRNDQLLLCLAEKEERRG
jgi:hypothetical protein